MDTTRSEVDGRRLGLAIATPIGFALLGAFLTGEAGLEWYDGLEKNWLIVPLWLFFIVGILYYVLGGFLCYRILGFEEGEQRWPMTWLLVVLLSNELWNAVFFGLQSIPLATAALIVYLVPLGLLSRELWNKDRLGFKMLMIYVAWVVQDFVWLGVLWYLNP